MTVTVHVEGGGRQNNKLESQCRRAFRSFFERAGVPRGAFQIIVCGARSEALKNFRTAHQNAIANQLPILLIDSEGPVSAADPWEHVGIPHRPDGATARQLHLMVQCMEAWFHADPQATSNYFGRQFQTAALSQRANLEAVSPGRLEGALKTASRDCAKGAYDKGSNSFAILATIDPAKVVAASPYAHRLIEFLRQVS